MFCILWTYSFIQSLDLYQGFWAISSLKDLKVLNISARFDDANDESVLAIIKSCNQLEKLILPTVSNLTDMSISEIPKFCPHIHELCINNAMVIVFY